VTNCPAFPSVFASTDSTDLAERVGAVVLGGDPSALGVVRSLGRQNIPVLTLVGQYRLAGLSKYCTHTLTWPERDTDQQLAFLLKIGKLYSLKKWLLFSSDDEHAAMLARNHKALSEHFVVPPPDWNTMRWAYDKRLTYELAQKTGVDYPMTVRPVGTQELMGMEFDYPVILKPAFKERPNEFTRARAWLARNREELLRLYQKAQRMIEPSLIMIQQCIPGGGECQFSYAGLHIDRHPVASLVVRRTRQYPIDFGRGSSFVETVRVSEVEAAARRWLGAMHYSGLVEIEFKYDSRDHRYKLLDVNSRIWSWHTLAAQAGVDFPYLLWRWMQNGTVDEKRARLGMKWIRLVRDVPAAIQEIRHRRTSVSEYIKSLRGVSAFAVFAYDDPVPAILELPLLLMWKLRHEGIRGAP